MFKRNVVGVTTLSRKPHLLADYAENKWSLKDYNFSLYIEKKDSHGDHALELRGDNQVFFSACFSFFLGTTFHFS